jgi:hypothetical protein
MNDERKELVVKETEARRKAANPLSGSWGEVKSLLDVLDRAPDPTEVRLQLRMVLQRIVDSIWLFVMAKGKKRITLVQMFFTGGKRRVYVIYFQPPTGNATAHRDGQWWVRSLVYGEHEYAGLDLRWTEDTREHRKGIDLLERLLNELDPTENVDDPQYAEMIHSEVIRAQR